MEFFCRRTGLSSDDKPCDEAFQKPYIRIDSRNTDDPEKVPAFQGDVSEWYGKGSNHRVIEGKYIARDFDDVGWFVRLETLDDLMAFSKKYGELVVAYYWHNSDIPSIEIYDDYRE